MAWDRTRGVEEEDSPNSIDGRATLAAVGSEYPVGLWEAWEWEKEYTCMHVYVSICVHLTFRYRLWVDAYVYVNIYIYMSIHWCA